MDKNRYIEKLGVFANMATRLSALSTCKRKEAKVGCVIFPFDCSAIYALGYNGQPAGFPHDACRDEVGDCGCIHAEANAIAKFNNDLAQPSILYTTRCPCEACAGLIINSRQIKLVIFRDEHSNTTGFTRIDLSHIYIYQESDMVIHLPMIETLRNDNI